MCTGELIHKLRVARDYNYSDLCKRCYLPMNVLRGMERNYIKACPGEIFTLAKAFDIPYIDLCTSWDEVEGCLEFKIEEMFETKTVAELRKAQGKGFYVPQFRKVLPCEYKLKTIAEMALHYKKNIFDVNLDLRGLSRRLGVTISVDSVKLSTVCEIAFQKGLNLSYVLGGVK